jgi:hypothetical protein
MTDNSFAVKKTPVILMIIFDFLTLGIYSCCWFLIRRESLNTISKFKKLGKTPFILCILLSVIGIVILVSSGILEGLCEATGDLGYASLALMLDGVNRVMDIVIGITLLVQSFKVKSMLESHLSRNEDGINPFAISLSGVGTFFFRNYYLQYRINKIHKEMSLCLHSIAGSARSEWGTSMEGNV